MLQLDLQHDFYSTVLKTKHKLHIATGLVTPPPQINNFVARLIPSITSSVVYMMINVVKYLHLCVLFGGRGGGYNCYVMCLEKDRK